MPQKKAPLEFLITVKIRMVELSHLDFLCVGGVPETVHAKRTALQVGGKYDGECDCEAITWWRTGWTQQRIVQVQVLIDTSHSCVYQSVPGRKTVNSFYAKKNEHLLCKVKYFDLFCFIFLTNLLHGNSSPVWTQLYLREGLPVLPSVVPSDRGQFSQPGRCKCLVLIDSTIMLCSEGNVPEWESSVSFKLFECLIGSGITSPTSFTQGLYMAA